MIIEMLPSKEIKALFIKFSERKCSPDEVQQILTYVKTSKNLSHVPTVEDLYDIIQELPNMTDSQADQMFENISKLVGPTKKPSHFWKYTAAALVIIALFSGYFYQNNSTNSPIESTPVIVETPIQIGTDKATLTLANGDEIPLDKKQKYVADEAISNGEELIYINNISSEPVINYNYLTIPRGGQFQVQLADGTKVWLNSETKLKYPTTFTKGETRQVELLYGEAYFEVSPSSKHNGSKFIVKTLLQDVEVLGTEFNIKAYKNEAHIYTTLVEGKVAINSMNKAYRLLPNQQAILNLDDENIAIHQVDVYNEISWKNGVFSFKGKPLIEIMTVLSRWYDVEFEFYDQSTERVKFNGVLSKKQGIDEILTIIKDTKFITTYEIKNKKIIIK